MNVLPVESFKILFVVQRLSDFVEMKRAAVSLKKFGYKCYILFCGVDSPPHDLIVLKEIEKSIDNDEIDGVEVTNKELVKDSEESNCTVPEKKIKSSSKSNLREILKWIKDWYKKYTTKLSQLKIKKPRALRPPITFIGRLCHYFKYLQFLVGSIIYVVVHFSLSLMYLPIFYVPVIYRFNYSQFRKIVKSGQYKLIILPEDIVGKVTPLIIKSGHSLKIPSIILPYTIANQTEAFQALKDREEFQVKHHFFNKVIGKLCRSWVMKDETRRVLRLPAEHVIGHLITRSSPPDPWMMNSGYANVIAIENEKMFEYYRNSGIPASKMKITGACYDDNLAYYCLNKESERNKLYQELGIKSNKPLFLIGGFPNQITANPPGFDFEDADDAVNFIVECLDVFKKDYEIIFRPHPNFLELSDYFKKKNILVTQIDTARLVALSDIYLAFASATIRWAISCGVPTINYDMFYYDFSDYKEVNGVLNVCTKEEFKQAINSMSEPEQFMVIKKQLDTEKRKWGNLDGKSTYRINELVKELIHLKKVPRKAS
ncbi:hypothetical protein [Legionella pneumophila]|uniref:CDP-Glycerol:Poly(Glycerophosphate) glycerophosphotransferase n=1 Tax=Legionella pneumophila subsp. pascullei TaxID=91890 RepID=A0AAX2IT47_LEGPN|nr:hypothetical protein [Legionella pneumophila]HAT9115399.1 hypothetical protein [Legionella pneumophila subsp. pneumophila]AMP91788.1 hypothetical protein AXF36_03900 [Legionella pneumophila subsp. pascullei]APF05601.1 hypothetical protein BIZ51_04140 [Legionella pneumophila subsp. fraseri]SQG89605.1 Uncharacterised protein [Legionella pneumophila subsp. pascullei]VEH05042.1 Uncharacterised protein [Legionella pneumophila subsp. pascullei]